jgi:hypothetical protein
LGIGCEELREEGREKRDASTSSATGEEKKEDRRRRENWKREFKRLNWP